MIVQIFNKETLCVILNVILQAHNITIKHIRGCKSFTALKNINPTTFTVEYEKWKYYISERKRLRGHLYALIICSNKFCCNSVPSKMQTLPCLNPK